MNDTTPTDETRESSGEDDGFGPITLPDSARPKLRKPSALRSAVEWVVVIGASLGVALLIQAFLLQPFRIPSASMNPTLLNGDRIVVNKLSYRLHPVHRGDVVVFTRPKCDQKATPAWADCALLGHLDDLVKRVVGLPGNKIYTADNKVFIDGRALVEPYVNKPVTIIPQPAGCGFAGTKAKPFVVPAHMVFVMGDNRNDSIDSRCFGPITEKSIVGRAFIRIWPISRIGGL